MENQTKTEPQSNKYHTFTIATFEVWRSPNGGTIAEFVGEFNTTTEADQCAREISFENPDDLVTVQMSVPLYRVSFHRGAGTWAHEEIPELPEVVQV